MSSSSLSFSSSLSGSSSFKVFCIFFHFITYILLSLFLLA
jgi:hypothetical protein